MEGENLSPNNPGYYTGSPSEGEEDSNNEENPYSESVNSEEYDHHQQQGTFKPFVNINMTEDREDDIMEEDGNLYHDNNCQPFSMNQGGNATFGTGGNNAPNSSSTGSSSNLSNQNFPKVSADGKKRRRFTPEEDKKIKEGIAKNKKDNNIDWDGVAKFAGIQRTKEQIKSRYMRMRKDDGAADVPPQQQPCPSSSNNLGTTTSSNINTDPNNRNAPQQRPSKAQTTTTQQPSPVYGVQPFSEQSQQHVIKADHSTSVESEEIEPITKKQKTLPQMFAQSAHTSGSTGTKKTTNNSLPPSSSSNQNSNSLFGDTSNSSFIQLFATNSNSITSTGSTSTNTQPYQQQVQKLQSEIEQLKEQLRQKDKQIEHLESKTKGSESEIHQLKNIVQDGEIRNNERNKRFREIAVQFLRERAERERIEDKRRVNEKSITIGTITYQKGMDVYEVWQDGTLFQQFKDSYNRIVSDRDKLEKQKKTIQKQRQQIKKEQAVTSSVDSDFARKLEEQMNDLNEQEESIKLSLNHLKKEEAQNLAEQEKLLIEKSIQIREIKRIRDQDKSMFKNYPIIGHQKYIPTTPDGPGTPQINGQQPQPSNHHEYFLMKMLGKGGFSEVYKAYDLTDYKVVACKIHQLNPNWKEHRKENYIKHVLRECQINQSINHDKLIKMYDTFVFDNNTFVTVLEYCEGADLDLYIKKHQKIPEREAKNIVAQVFSGLNYLSQQKQKVIHYDLKPANILFDKDGNIKITDFGLSKIMDEEESIELTSQGAGTYWYLPPECFHNPSGEGPPPKISNKVDVWSAGVIFYQMLYGTKPFGNNLSQQKILSEGTIVNATQVAFPEKPTVSEEAKEFIRRCLTHDMIKRPDVRTLYNDPYLRGSSSSSGSSKGSKKKESQKDASASTTPTSTNFLSYQ